MPKFVDPDEAVATMLAAGLEPLEPYPGARVGWKSRCRNCGLEGAPTFPNVRSGLGGCVPCGRQATTEAQRVRGFIIASEGLRSAGWELLTKAVDYKNARTKVEVKCVDCGNKAQGDAFGFKTRKCRCKRGNAARSHLAEKFPELALEIHPSLNGGLDPRSIGTGMRANIWWLCEEGHQFQASPANRVRGSKCGVCAGQVVLAGVNDLATTNPELLSRWHPTRNEIGPDSLTAGSNRKVWWKCDRDPRHEWAANPWSIANGSGCPVCSGHLVMEGVNDLASRRPDLAREFSTELNSFPVETVYVTSLKPVWWKCVRNERHTWRAAPSSRIRLKSGCPYCANQKVLQGDNDLATVRPDLAQEWHPTRNLPETPNSVGAGSSKQVWWQCSEVAEHVWRRDVAGRAFFNSGCPFCSGTRAEVGVTDLLSVHPELAKLIDPEDIPIARNLRPGSHQKLRWICSKQTTHRWTASGRNTLAYGCGFCDGRWVIAGENDIGTTHPNLAREWVATLNESTPSQVKATSNKKAYWRCSSDSEHVWRAVISSRAKGNGCPYCAKYRILAGNNDLATTHPELLSERIERPQDPPPNSIHSGSKVRYLWRCVEHSDHHWESSVAQRTRFKTGCPICQNLKLKVGFNDFATTHPEAAADFHPSLNEGLAASDFVAGTNRKVWWQCANVPEHSFLQSVNDHAAGKGCSRCAPKGFRISKPSKFYFIENLVLDSYKVGITNTDATVNRIEKWRKAGWRVIFEIESPAGIQILALETALLRWIRREEGLPAYLLPPALGRIGGYSETFQRSAISEKKVLEQINRRWNRLKDETPN